VPTDSIIQPSAQVFDISYGQVVDIDDLDRALVHALQLDGRAPFSRIAEVLGVSDQTIARRYRRIRAANLARVVGQTYPWRVGQVRWQLRIRCAPDAAAPIATAIARRPDTYWVHIVSGGTEINCVTQVKSADEPNTLLLQKLPRTPRVIDVSAHCLMHTYFGGAMEHPGLLNSLTPEQTDALRPPPASTSDEIVPLDAQDELMLTALQRDGRAGYPELAAATGWSESTAKRRLDFLRESGALFFDIDIDTPALGFHSEARMWLSVAPADLTDVGEALAQHPEVAFAAATTGTTNLFAAVVCRDVPSFYRYLTERVGKLTAVNHIETTPIIQTVKRGATLVNSQY
jgi:DNA-binding Lrp family transcriptional regulator